MAEALAEIARGRTAAAATALDRLMTNPQDSRRAVLEALLLARHGDWGTAEARVAGETRAAPPSPLLASARYHLQLWQVRFGEARAAAQEERLAAKDTHGRALWAERAGDAAFLGRDLDLAEQLYQDALRENVYPQALLGRLADIRFLRGDLAGERSLRERVYASLRPLRKLAGEPAPRP